MTAEAMIRKYTGLVPTRVVRGPHLCVLWYNVTCHRVYGMLVSIWSSAHAEVEIFGDTFFKKIICFSQEEMIGAIVLALEDVV